MNFNLKLRLNSRVLFRNKDEIISFLYVIKKGIVKKENIIDIKALLDLVDKSDMRHQQKHSRAQ
ncbi:hypothetical protein LCGC14_1301360 [marine sediment metagenome]|uniref:Uncharacterized protein n=1 Tax=marine sediment metagenome TaxID=412755 RepID=A0A0F9LA61_9ZZZZ